MKNLIRIFCIFLWGMSDLLHAEEPQVNSKVISEPSPLQPIIESNNQFSFDLYHQLTRKPGNLFFSPYSIAEAFAMLTIGAQGETAQEMEKVLHLTPSSLLLMGQLHQKLSTDAKNPTQLHLANALWLQEDLSLLNLFQLALKQNFNSTVKKVNFEKEPAQAVKTINEWVEKQTQGKIRQLFNFNDITKQTRLVLTSAIYMRAQWAHLFDTKLTAKANFKVTERQTLEVDMMKIIETYPLYVSDDFALIELPYLTEASKDLQLALTILLPHENTDFSSLEESLNFDNWQVWNGKMLSRRVQLMLPRFKVEDRLNLNQTLIELGMVQAFNNQADFSGITGNKTLMISEAIHKTFIQVDEKGTEAAAATGISMNLKSVFNSEEPYYFTADHPFIYIIHDKNTRAILFIGKLTTP